MVNEERELQRRLEGLEKKYRRDMFNPISELPKDRVGEGISEDDEGNGASENNFDLNDEGGVSSEEEIINGVSEVEDEFVGSFDKPKPRLGFFNKALKGDNLGMRDGAEIKNEISKFGLGDNRDGLGDNGRKFGKGIGGLGDDIKGSVERVGGIVQKIESEQPDKFANKVIMNSAGVSGRLSQKEITKVSNQIGKLKKEVGKALIGQEDLMDSLILGLMCNAHVLVEGVPGIAKTLAIRALAAASGCDVKRIQFTVDMLPTDIIGLTTYTPDKGFETLKGPIFTNFLIADEINRAPPKTQSALIEGMQEKQVTIGRKQYHLPDPFFVMATENPIENAGVYPLPEAQIDRFLFKVLVGYPEKDAEWKIMESNMTLQKFEDFNVQAVMNPKQIKDIQAVVKKIYLDDSIKEYILQIVRKTRERDFDSAEYLTYGSSPRASIGLFIASKARALMKGRNYVLPQDVKYVVYSVLRHRIILSYKATIDKISPDAIISKILESVRVE